MTSCCSSIPTLRVPTVTMFSFTKVDSVLSTMLDRDVEHSTYGYHRGVERLYFNYLKWNKSIGWWRLHVSYLKPCLWSSIATKVTGTLGATDCPVLAPSASLLASSVTFFFKKCWFLTALTIIYLTEATERRRNLFWLAVWGATVCHDAEGMWVRVALAVVTGAWDSWWCWGHGHEAGKGECWCSTGFILLYSGWAPRPWNSTMHMVNGFSLLSQKLFGNILTDKPESSLLVIPHPVILTGKMTLTHFKKTSGYPMCIHI